MTRIKVSHSLKIRYLIGLSLIAILVSASYITMQTVIAEQRNFSKLINLASQQNALANRIAYFATLMVSTDDEDEYEQAGVQLRRGINRLRHIHALVYNGSESENIPRLMNDNLVMIYDDPSVGLNAALDQFLSHATSISQTEFGELTNNSYSFLYLTTYGPHALEPMLNALLDEFETVGREAILHIERLELAIWISAMIILFLEAMLIFRPFELKLRKAINTLEHAKKRHELAAESAAIGVWELNLKTGELTWDNWMYQLFGISHNQTADLNKVWKNFIHEDDLQRANEEIEQAIEKRHHYESEYRIRRNHDEIRWIRVNATFLQDDASKALLMIGTSRDITLRRQADLKTKQNQEELEKQVKERTYELEKSKRKAEAANHEKSRFLSNMSHELRTPMHAILSFTHLALKRDQDQKTTKYLDNISTSAKRLTELLDNLLDLAKLESGKMQADYAESDLHKLFNVHIEGLRSLLIEKKLKVEFIQNEPVTAEFDQRLMGQVLTNLLSNAIKFSDKGMTISIEILRKPGNEVEYCNELVEFIITDQGIGIPREELTAVFDSFVQSSKTVSQAGGTGLGLPLCKEIVELHRGHIWAESPIEENKRAANNPESIGTAFHVVIPACSPKET